MTATQDATRDPVLPTEEEANKAKEWYRILEPMAARKWLRVMVEGAPEPEVELPEVAVSLLVRILEETAKGNAVTVMPYHAELTTQQAADILNVSHPFFVKLLEDGVLPLHRVGTDRRVRFQDVMAYRNEQRSAARRALDELASEAQDLGIGYE